MPSSHQYRGNEILTSRIEKTFPVHVISNSSTNWICQQYTNYETWSWKSNKATPFNWRWPYSECLNIGWRGYALRSKEELANPTWTYSWVLVPGVVKVLTSLSRKPITWGWSLRMQIDTEVRVCSATEWDMANVRDFRVWVSSCGVEPQSYFVRRVIRPKLWHYYSSRFKVHDDEHEGVINITIHLQTDENGCSDPLVTSPTVFLKNVSILLVVLL